MRPARSPILPAPPEPFYWREFPDRDWGPFWQARADTPTVERFAQVYYRKAGWIAMVGLYRRAPRKVRVGDLMPAVAYVNRWLTLHGPAAIEEAKACELLRRRNPSVRLDARDEFVARIEQAARGHRLHVQESKGD